MSTIPEAPQQSVTKTETLLGGSTITVNTSNGGIEVKVRQVPIKEFPAFLAVQDDEHAMIEFVCGQKKGFAETLTQDDHERLISEIDRVNGDFFPRWVQRRLKRSERLMPGITEKATASAGSNLPSGLQK